MGALIFTLTSLTSWQPKTLRSVSRPYVALRTEQQRRSRLNPNRVTGCSPKGRRQTMTDELIAMKGDDYGTLANTMLSLCEGHPAALALAAASAVVSRLIGTCSVSESEAVL